MNDQIRKVAPEAAVLHAAYQSDLVGRHYPGLEFVPPLAALVGVASLPEARRWEDGHLAAIVSGADVVLSQGGGFLIERYEPWERLAAYERVLDLGVPLGFVAQTIGRFRRQDNRALLMGALRRAVVLGVRDRRSVENVVDLGIPRSRVRLGVDQAFGLLLHGRRPPNRQGVAVVLSRHTLIEEDRYVGEEPGLLQALTQTVRFLGDAVDPEPVTLLSTSQGLGATDRGLEDDSFLASEIIAQLPRGLRRRTRRPDGYLSPLRFAGIIGRHRAVVSMRMHPLIFALSQGVPVVAVTRAHKTVDLLARLELGDVVPPWLDPEAIAAALSRLLEASDGNGSRSLPSPEPLRAGAKVNQQLLSELVSAAHPGP